MAGRSGAREDADEKVARACCGDDATVFEFWAGNPSVEIAHGHIRAVGGAQAQAVPERAAGAGGAACAPSSASSAGLPLTSLSRQSCIALASSVPCYMSAPEFCDFVGAFGDETHRRFRHCRVLHGRNPEEYLMAVWLPSPEATAAFIKQFDGKRYNAIEPGECRLHRIVGCMRNALAPEEMAVPGSPHAVARQRSASACGHSPTHQSLPSPAPSPSHTHSLPAVPRRMHKSPSPMQVRAVSPAALPRLALDMPGEVPFAVEDLFSGCAAMQGGSAASTGEKAFCAVCLEPIEANPANYQLTELGGGCPLTILCGHTFHARCLSRWCDSTCPVCRFQQHPYQTSCCDVCGQSEGLHICLVCGNIGCIVADGEGHAHQHFEATSHTYALEVSTQRVWDYAGNGYVHRLLYNQTDGKMVEQSVPALPSAYEDLTAAGGRGERAQASVSQAAAGAEPPLDPRDLSRDLSRSDLGGRPPAKKQESLVSEFNALLSSQMTAQRRHFEDLQKQQELAHARNLEELREHRQRIAAGTEAARQQLRASEEANAALEREAAEAAAAEDVVNRQRSQLEALNQRIAADQQVFEDKVEGAREKERARQRSRALEVEELQQQIRDLELYVQMRRKCQGATDHADLQGSHVVVTEAEPRGRAGRRQRRR